MIYLLHIAPCIHAVSGEILRSVPETTTLWSSGDKLNFTQLEALKLSLKRQFLLIQGPPGMLVYVLNKQNNK